MSHKTSTVDRETFKICLALLPPGGGFLQFIESHDFTNTFQLAALSEPVRFAKLDDAGQTRFQSTQLETAKNRVVSAIKHFLKTAGKHEWILGKAERPRDDSGTLVLDQLKTVARDITSAYRTFISIGSPLLGQQVLGESGNAVGHWPTQVSKETVVLTLLFEHPEWNDMRIAKEAGIARTSLYRMQKFVMAKSTLKQGKNKFSKRD